ncbi:MAG TPA: hypothetical protein VJQ55_14245 [Candidatus Binatia bacterium]|nr:hypothetical protein [Candidatus Binatia bacterium]
MKKNLKWGMMPAFALSLCLAADVGYAKSGPKGKSGNSTVEYEADLEPVIVAPAIAAVEPNAGGDVRYRKQIHKGTTKTERFEAKVRIPFPSAALGIVDTASAQAADVQLFLSSATTPTVYYATCALDLTGIETEFEDGAAQTFAVYKVDVRKELRNRALRQREIHGVCDVDVVTAEAQNGTPVPADHDIATAAVVTTTPPVAPATTPTIVSTVFLSGELELD